MRLRPWLEVHTARHTALFSLGRLEEADEEYRAIEGLCSTALLRAEATAVQVRSLTHRKRLAEAVDLGLETLRALGRIVPSAVRLPAEIDRHFDHLHRWLEDADAAGDQARPGITDPALLATARIVNAVVATAYFAADPAMQAWLSLEALRIWIEHGPGPALAGPAGHSAVAVVALRGDYAAGYRTARRILAVAETRGYEPGTSQMRQLFANFCCWFEPIENGVQAARQARAGLIADGDLANAGYAYSIATYFLADCAPTLETFLAEVDAGLAFARRTGNEQTGQWFEGYRWLAGVLRGEGSAAADEAIAADRYAANPAALFYAHLSRAQAAAIFGDLAALTRHTAAVLPLRPGPPRNYPTAAARLLRGLALAGQARASQAGERAGLLSGLDDVTRWLAARAADAPDNFLHLLRLLEAERAWAAGDFRAAAVAFDAARREAAQRQRPWHRAMIAERAARFHLAHGLDHAGYGLLAQARQDYLAWGGTAKVDQLDWAYPALQPRAGATAGHDPGDLLRSGATVTTGTIDLLGVLSASQALSSETSIGRLHARVAEVVGAMTGATAVHLVLWSEDRHGWLLSAPDGGVAAVTRTGHEHATPMSVLRYAQRVGEPLVVADATSDDRFARDPYFAEAGCCSLLALPILSRGILRAVLLLENRLIRGAFTAGRLDAVKLIAGQLAVSLDNAQLYAELTASRARIVAAADQTRRRIERDLHDGAQQQLVSLALRMRAVRAAVPPGRGDLVAELDSLAAGLNDALDEVREIARGIHPAVLAKGGLQSALKVLARRSAIPVDLHVHADRSAARAGRGQCVLRRRRGADQRGQARARLDRRPSPSRSSATYCASRSATTAPAAPTSLAAPAWPASRTAWRHSAAGSSSTARPGREPACVPSSRSPRTAASRPASPRSDCWVTQAATVLGGGCGNGRTGHFSRRPEWGGLLASGMALVT